MLYEFIEYVETLLPGGALDKKEKALEAIRQFEDEGKQIKYLLLSPLEELSQGDIISTIPFSYFEEDGSQKIFSAEGMVLSTSCNIDHKEKIIIAPVLPIDSFTVEVESIKENRRFDYFYVDDIGMKDKYIDFNSVCSYNKNLITSGIGARKIKRLHSLNDVGLYFLIIKLTVFLMRKEDPLTFSERSSQAS